MKRALLLDQTGMETNARGRTIFRVRTGENGWRDLGLRPVEVWREDVMKEWAGEKVGDGLGHEYIKYLKRTKTHKKTPGTAAGITLCIKGFEGYLVPGQFPSFASNTYHEKMLATAYAATPFLLSQVQSWEMWCKQRSALPSRKTYLEFACKNEEDDIPLHGEIKNAMREMLPHELDFLFPATSESGPNFDDFL